MPSALDALSDMCPKPCSGYSSARTRPGLIGTFLNAIYRAVHFGIGTMGC